MGSSFSKWQVRLIASVFLTIFPRIVSAAEIAPYFYSWGGSLTQARQASGLKSATAAFAITRGTCVLDSSFINMLPEIRSFISSGGSLITSFGGADGTYVEVACTDENQLFNLIDKVIQDTGSQRLDFDVEGSQLSDTVATARRTRVLARIQAKYPNMYLSFTLPGWLFNGLPVQAINLLRNTLDGGVRINIVNVMAMDFGASNVATQGGGNMTNSVIMTIQAAANQLKTLYPNLTTAQVYAKIGITPMIGTNDDGTTFSLADAANITEFGIQNGVGLISYWAFQRDVAQSTAGLRPLNNYSGVVQSYYQYYNTFKRAESGTSTPPPPPPETDSSSCNYPNWVVNQQYAAGSIVKYTNGYLYIAKFANPGYNPTISTYYWALYTCSTVTDTSTSVNTIRVALSSSSFLKSTLARGEVQTIQANLNSASGASDVIVQIQIRDSLRNIVQTRSYPHVNLAAGVITSFKFDYQVPSTLALGLYHIEVGVFSQSWVTYLYVMPTTTFAVTAPVVVCNYPSWVVYKYYAAGSIVKYTDGKLYFAKYANPGYNPTISTYYWAPYTCK